MMNFPPYMPVAVQTLVTGLLESNKLSARDADYLRRLASDPRMRDAYKLLHGEFTRDGQWRDFIIAALTACMDFGKCRETKREDAEALNDIAATAEKLEKLVRKFSLTDTGPAEFQAALPHLEPFLHAREFRRVDTEMIAAATKSRQHNPKREYLRAFAHELGTYDLSCTTKTMQQAMAVVASVAINLPDVDVSYEDVKTILHD